MKPLTHYPTFLTFVAVRTLGQPYDIYPDGQWWWNCPNCGKADHKFHSRPPKEGMKDRCACFACDYFADEYDLVGIQDPSASYAERHARLAELKAEFDQTHKNQAADLFFLPGTGGIHPNGNGDLLVKKPARKQDLDAALADVWEGFAALDIPTDAAIQVIALVLQAAKSNGVDAADILLGWIEFERWKKELNERLEREERWRQGKLDPGMQHWTGSNRAVIKEDGKPPYEAKIRFILPSDGYDSPIIVETLSGEYRKVEMYEVQSVAKHPRGKDKPSAKSSRRKARHEPCHEPRHEPRRKTHHTPLMYSH